MLPSRGLGSLTYLGPGDRTWAFSGKPVFLLDGSVVLVFPFWLLEKTVTDVVVVVYGCVWRLEVFGGKIRFFELGCVNYKARVGVQIGAEAYRDGVQTSFFRIWNATAVQTTATPKLLMIETQPDLFPDLETCTRFVKQQSQHWCRKVSLATSINISRWERQRYFQKSVACDLLVSISIHKRLSSYWPTKRYTRFVNADAMRQGCTTYSVLPSPRSLDTI